MADYPGNDTLYLVKDVPELDGDGHEVKDELDRPKMTVSLFRVEGCVFELQVTVTPERFEQVGVTTNTSDIRWAFLPVIDGQVPGFDADNEAGFAPPPSSDMRVRYLGLDWQVRGDAAVEVDLDGFENHVFAMCERQTG